MLSLLNHLVGYGANVSTMHLLLEALTVIGGSSIAIALLYWIRKRFQSTAMKCQIAEAALQVSEAELRAIFAAMTELIMLFDSQGRHLKIAPTNQKILYKSLEERIGKTLHEIFPQDQADFFLRQIQQVLESGKSLDIEYSLSIDNQEIWSAATISPLTPNSVVWVARDITARKQAEAAMQKEQDFLDAVLHNVEDGILACDEHGALTLFNRAVQKFHILPQMALPPEQWSEHYDLYLCNGEAVASEEDALLYRALRGEYIRNIELLITPKDGTPCIILASGQPIWGANAQKLGAVLVLRDITERKQAEELLRQVNEELELRVKQRTTDLQAAVERLEAEILERQQVEAALRESEQRFRATFNQAAVGITQNDLEGHWILVNQRFCDIVGYTEAELQGLTFKDITHPDDLSLDLELYEQLLTGKIQILSLDKRYFRKDGSLVWASLTTSLVKDMDGKPKYGIAILEDISQRKQIEENIRKSLEREKELSQLKSRFIETVSHELRTPLTTITSSIDLLESKNYALNDARRSRHFKQINSSITRINAVIQDTLVVSQLQAGALHSHPTLIHLNHFCQEFVSGWSCKGDCKHQIIFNDSSNCSLMIHSDQDLLRQILTQLLLNAIRYSPQGGDILVELNHHDQAAMIKIKDWGIGIPQEELTCIFDKFYRGSNANLVPGTPGLGIGLAIVKEALALQEGAIAVESEVSQGSTFIVSLPLKEVLSAE